MLGASRKDIGVDIERIKEFNPKVANRFFTSQEYENIMAQKDEEERKRLFFLYWVIKESFIKYSGKGLSQALNSFRIDIGKNGKITVKKGLKKKTYTIKIKVTAAGNSAYNAKSKTVKVKIKVK